MADLSHGERKQLELAVALASRPRMEFASWIARMRTPPTHMAAIRALQASAAADVAAHFQIEPDGSFLLDSVLIEAHLR